jgi:hypothetical protein
VWCCHCEVGFLEVSPRGAGAWMQSSDIFFRLRLSVRLTTYAKAQFWRFCTMSSSISKKRSMDKTHSRPAKRPKIVRRQREYHSSSEEEQDDTATFGSVNLGDSDEERLPVPPTNNKRSEVQKEDNSVEDGIDAELDEDEEEDSVSDDESEESETSTAVPRKKRKRNDPDAFATSMSKILGSKLSSSKRADPVLSRSKSAATITQEQADSKLEEKARRKLRDEKKQAADKGRIRDVFGTEQVDGQTAVEVQELERRLRKTAQRGVVKLFNAVRAAQVRAEEAERDAKAQGVVGVGKREERINEMSKKGFLDLIAGGGKKNIAS